MEDAITGRAGLRVEVTPEDSFDEVITLVSAALLRHPLVRQDFTLADLWMVSFDVLGKEAGSVREWLPNRDSGRFHAIVRDLASGRTLTATGHLDDPQNLVVGHTANQLPPTDDEFAWAVDALETGDRVTGPYKTPDEIPYRPMPPLGGVEHADGSVERVIAVGLRAPDGSHRVVGVSAGDGSFVPRPVGAVSPSDSECGVPLDDSEVAPATKGSRQARVRVWQGEELLWDLVVVRPSASSGINGSGVELRDVDYRGKRVLHRAHVPIVNVAYDDGTSRHWQNEEAGFDAVGDDPVAGFRLCHQAPSTVLESGADGGDFRGVALWLDTSGTSTSPASDGADSEPKPEVLVITSQLQAGWYRYVSEWRLSGDGTIGPRFGFSAAANPETCRPHVHHAYWRLDFDVETALENVIQEFNDPPVFGTSNWHTMRYEARRLRDSTSGRYWRVRQDRSSACYQLVAGEGDGTTDDFGAGDVWVLAYRSSEIDDGQGFSTDPHRARAQLDRFVTGEPVHREDLVVWYAAHVRHDAHAPDGKWETRVGPELVPRHWALADPPSQEGDIKPSELAPPPQ